MLVDTLHASAMSTESTLENELKKSQTREKQLENQHDLDQQQLSQMSLRISELQENLKSSDGEIETMKNQAGVKTRNVAASKLVCKV